MAALPSVSGNSVGSAGRVAVDRVMEVHYRDALKDSKVDYSPAWRDAKLAIRHLNTVSPVLLSLIKQQGAFAPIEDRIAGMDFMIKSVDSLSKVMAECLADTADAKAYDRIELTSMLGHLVGRITEAAPADQEQQQIDELLRTVAAIYSNDQFRQRHESTAQMMMEKIPYLRVDSPETMSARLRVAMHQATLRLYESIVDERLSNGRGTYFLYGLSRTDLLSRLGEDFNGLIGDFLATARFAPVLSNDQRAIIMQSWIKQASEIYRSEYVINTLLMMDWFKAGETVSKQEFKNRFVQAKASLPGVLERAREATAKTLAELVAYVGFDGVPEPTEHEATAAPQP